MTGIVIGLLVVTTLSLALRNTLWVGFLGVFLLCNLYPTQAIVAVAIAAIAFLFVRYRQRRKG